MRVLIVDDDRFARMMMVEALRDEGYEVDEAEDVPGARPLLAACEVAVIDMVLPGEPGLALLRDAVGGGRAALMVTGGVSASEQVEAMRGGAYDVLQKPVDRELLVRAVSRAAERVELARENRRLLERLEGRARDLELERGQLIGELEDRAKAIARAKLEWERTFDAIQDAIAVLDGDLRIVRANHAFGANRGATSGGAGARCHEALFGAAERCDGCPLGAMAGTAASTEIVREGRLFRVDAFPVAIGRGTHVVVHEDVTDRRRLGDRLARSERLAAVGRLAAGVAHEINNPLSYVAANVRAARAALAGIAGAAGADAPWCAAATDAMDALRDAEAGAERVARIVSSLKVIAGDRAVELVAVSVQDSLERALDAVRRAIGPSGGDVAVAWDAKASAPALADPLRLDRACQEILKNAFQATRPGGHVALRTFQDRDHVVAEVEDEGPGIPPEVHPRLGEPFFTSGGVGSGRGLGLAVACGIVRTMGGEVTVASERGRGTRVRIVLRRAAQEPTPEA